jgi:hypothetical protein
MLCYVSENIEGMSHIKITIVVIVTLSREICMLIYLNAI